jgi:hypothetical protein
MKNAFVALVATAILASTASAGSASAEILTFDDVSVSSYQAIPNAYHGLTFNSFAFIGPAFGASGYRNGVVSGANSACGCAADDGRLYSSITGTSAFSVDSGFFTSAWNNGATLSITGLLNGAVLYTSSTILNATGPTFINLGFNGINEARFAISGGTSARIGSGAGNYFAVDNLSVNGAVPEPATWGMMIAGFGMMGAALRTRRRSATVSFA